MGEYGESLSGAITSQRGYGATSNQSFLLAVFDSRVITHQLNPTDTLQGLAIKYSVSVEKIKRLNKLWSNESIHTKDTILIPCSKENITCDSPKTRYVDSLERKKSKQQPKPVEGEHDELHSSLKENEGDVTNITLPQEKSETMKSFDKMFKKIDGQIKDHKELEGDDLGSDSYKCFTEMLSKIDQQIKTHKNKNVNNDAPSSSLPNVGYDSYQNRVGSPVSPSRQHPFLEQGI